MKFCTLLLLISFTLTSLSLFGHENDLHFIQNKGQWPQQVNFRADLSGGKMWLENNKISYQFIKYPNLHANFQSTEEPIVQQHVVWAEFIGSNTNFNVEQNSPTHHYYNYLLGNDPSKWATNVYGYEEVKYLDLYQDIDFRIYTSDGNTKYDFVVKPGGKNTIKIHYQGQDKIEINKNGELVVYTTLGQIIEEAPFAYQIIDGIKQKIDCKYVLKGDQLTFKIGDYDKNIDLIIDPVLIFASYNGSPSDNFGMTATYDNDGNLYTGGIVYGANYPTTPGVYDPVGSFPGTVASSGLAPVYGITDVYVTKFAPNGSSLVYSTYIGGGDQNGGTEAVHSLICDSLGNLHMYGTTSSSDFPTSATAYQDTLAGGNRQLFQFNGIDYIATGGITNGGGTDIFVTKLNATGSAILGSTFIGGTGNDGLNYHLSGGSYNSVAAYDSLTKNYGDQFRGEIMLDDSGYVYIASSTHSTDFPLVGGVQGVSGGYQDAIVCKFSPNLDNLIWSSYLGGTEKDAGYSVKVNHNGEVIVAGGTCSNTFPTTPASINPAYMGGMTDGFITKLTSNGSSIISSTFMGTNSYDQCYFVEVDRFGTLYTVGQTNGNFPVFNAPYFNPNSGTFIVKMDSNISNVEYSTIFGNGNVNSEFSPSAFLVDRCQNVYVSGWGGNILGSNALHSMPITHNNIQSAAGDNITTTSGDGFNFYLTVFERNMQSQLFGIYYGGGTSREHVDGGTSRFDKNGIIYQSVCAGCGNNDDFPTTTGAWSNTNESSNCNNGVFKFDFEIIPEAQFSVDQFSGCAPLTVTFNNTSGQSDEYLWDFGGGDTTSQIFNPVKTYSTPGVYNVTLLITDSICNTTDTAFQTITVGDSISLNSPNTFTTCDTGTIYITYTGVPTYFIWSSNNQFTDTLNPNLTDTSLFVSGLGTQTYYIMSSNGPCIKYDSITVTFEPVPQANFLPDTSQGCVPLTVTFNNTSDPSDGYLWNFGNGDTTSQVFNPSVTYTSPGVYNVSLLITDSLCDRTDTAFYTITVEQQPTLSGGTTIATCDTTTLSINSTGNPNYFIWSSNNMFTDTLNNNLSDSSLFVTVSDTTWYYVMAGNSLCTAIDSFRVDFMGFSIFARDTSICAEQTPTITTSTNSNTPLTYSWSPTNSIVSGGNSATPVVNPTTSTTYTVTAQNTHGCTSSDTALVTVSGFDPNIINVWADNDSIFVSGGTYLHVTPNTGFTYTWIPPFGLDDPTSSDPYCTPDIPSTTTYTVSLLENGTTCRYQRTITIYAFELVCEEPDIFIPNAFTPNQDKENDILFVRGRNVEEMNLKIYNRWGELVFETDKQSVGWDGTFKGELVDPAVFVYHLTVKCVDGQEYFKKGNVTVIR